MLVEALNSYVTPAVFISAVKTTFAESGKITKFSAPTPATGVLLS
jgi:hypothetical protein